MHMCISLSQQLEGMSSVGTVSVFCAEIATKVETSRKWHHAVSHRYALRYKEMKNTMGFVTKKKLLQKRSQPTQNFLTKLNQCRNSTLPLTE